MKIAVLGAGGWGTALARLLSMTGHSVVLWGHNPSHLIEIESSGCNERYLPGVSLKGKFALEPDLTAATGDVEAVVVAVPSKAFRSVTAALREFQGIVVTVTKGIEYDTGLTMSGVLVETVPKASIAALSGPSLAAEVARDIPTATVAASHSPEVAKIVQQLFHGPSFRVYRSADLLGVELGGALKNVIAIAGGMGDGLNFGDNSKAAAITRGIVEIQRLGVACGALAETFSGLSGLGDLTVTCFSKLSRNRAFGERLGRGEKPAAIAASTDTVAEGYPTARSAFKLARRLNVETPIMDAVHAVLYEGKTAPEAVRDLMKRDTKSESALG